MTVADATEVDQAAAAAPTVSEARRLAEQVARDEPLVERILLFGSVARGDAGQHSDYDMVIVLADAAEEGFVETALRLRREVTAATDSLFERRCDVEVRLATDWAHTTANVSASFDAAIVDDTVELVARPNGNPVRGRRRTPTILPGVPVSNTDTAASFLDAADTSMQDVSARLRLVAEDEAGRHDAAARRAGRRQRYVSVLSNSHLAIELAVKSLVAAEGGAMVKTHEIDNRVDAIADPATRQAVQDIIEDIRQAGAITDFRLGIYHIDNPSWQPQLTAANAAAFVRTAVSVVSFAADNLLQRPASGDTHAVADRARATADAVAGLGITSHLLETGISAPPPPEP